MTNSGRKICEYVNEDKDLYTFFKQLTYYYEMVKSEEIKVLDNSHDIDNILNAISETTKKIEDSGIVITGKENWLEKGLYMNLAVPTSYIFSSVRFNGYIIDDSEVAIFQRRIWNKKNETPIWCLSDAEIKYVEWHKNNDYNSLKKEYEKENKKYRKKIENGKKELEKPIKLKKLENLLQYIDELNKKAEFFQNINEQQMIEIIEVRKQIDNMRFEYNRYLSIRERERNYIDQNYFKLCETAFLKMTEENLVNIDINNIIKKIVVIYLVVKNNFNDEELPKKEFDFDTNLIGWFADFKDKEMQTLYSKIFEINNFSLAIDSIYDKVLKK